MDIPEDVVPLILVRLPVKSLLRFRCVCKSWRGLIGSRRFIDTHLRHPSRGNGKSYLVLLRFVADLHDEYNPMLSFYDADLKAAAPDLRGFPDKLSISGPVNGICLVGGEPRGIEPDGEHPLYLFNPATREVRKIPDRPFGRQRARPPMFNPPFDCRRVSAGLGYDPRTSNYKVVSLMLFIEDHYYSGPPPPCGPLKIEIYDLSSDSWRVADTVFPTVHVHPDDEPVQPSYPVDLNTEYYGYGMGMFEHNFTCGLFFNGSIHWHPTNGSINVILAFNVSDEVMLAFDLPRDVSFYQNSLRRTLFVLDDSLAFVQRVMHEVELFYPTSSFYVWVMTEYGDGESWIKRFYFEPGIPTGILAFWNGMLLCETTEDGDLISCNLQGDHHHFKKHHHITGHVPQLTNQQGRCWNIMAAMVMHKESLVRLGQCS